VAQTPTRGTRPGRPDVIWDDGLEGLYGSWHRRIAAAEIGHRVMSDRMQRRYLMLGLPVVVLTTIVGTSVFASLQDAKVSTTTRIVVGSISIAAAVLSSLQTFLRYATRAEGHRVAAIRYETLRRDVAATLALPRSARTDPVRELDSVRTRMDRYAKESPSIGQRYWERLEERFHLSSIPPDPPWLGRTVTIPESEPPVRAGVKEASDDAEGRADGR
jgi:hypothetical protein